MTLTIPYVQQFGRIKRLNQKPAVIVDHADNLKRVKVITTPVRTDERWNDDDVVGPTLKDLFK